MEKYSSAKAWYTFVTWEIPIGASFCLWKSVKYLKASLNSLLLKLPSVLLFFKIDEPACIPNIINGANSFVGRYIAYFSWLG